VRERTARMPIERPGGSLRYSTNPECGAQSRFETGAAGLYILTLPPRQAVKRLPRRVAVENPKAWENPGAQIALAHRVHKVLQNLRRQSGSIRDAHCAADVLA